MFERCKSKKCTSKFKEMHVIRGIAFFYVFNWISLEKYTAKAIVIKLAWNENIICLEPVRKWFVRFRVKKVGCENDEIRLRPSITGKNNRGNDFLLRLRSFTAPCISAKPGPFRIPFIQINTVLFTRLAVHRN